MSEKVVKEIYVMRHGEAERRASSDAERALTDRGRQEVAANVARLPSGVDLVIASPYLRAQQTVKIACDTAQLSLPVETLELITPVGIPRQVEAWLQERSWHKVLCVTHQPFAGQFVEYLTGDTCYDFPTAGIAKVTLETLGPALGRYHWLT